MIFMISTAQLGIWMRPKGGIFMIPTGAMWFLGNMVSTPRDEAAGHVFHGLHGPTLRDEAAGQIFMVFMVPTPATTLRPRPDRPASAPREALDARFRGRRRPRPRPAAEWVGQVHSLCRK